jgi:multiple sugar transport system substrate-binding protein
MRRTALVAAALGLALPASGHAQDIVLKFWDNQQTESGLSAYQQEAVKSFEAENPGIKVEVTMIPYPEYQQRLLTAVQGGNAPDVSTVDQIWVAAFAQAGAIDPLGELADKAGIIADTFFPGAWASANYDGQLWGIPLSPRYLEVSDIEVTLAQDVFAGMDPNEAAEKACAAIDALR